MARHDAQLPLRFPDPVISAAVCRSVIEAGLIITSKAQLPRGGCVMQAEAPKNGTVGCLRPSVRVSWFHPREDPEMFWLSVIVEAMGTKHQVVKDITQLGDDLVARVQSYCDQLIPHWNEAEAKKRAAIG